MQHTDPQPLVSIVTVNYNSKQETLELIKSLEYSNYKNWELHVVDNASREDPTSDIKILNPEVNVILSKVNLGFAGGNNLALPFCKGKYIFFVNNDTELPENCLQILIDTAENLSDLGALSPKFEYYYGDGKLEYAGCTNINSITARNRAIGHGEPATSYEGLIETFYIHGGGMLVPGSVIEDVGPMAEEFFLYYEEMDWSERIRRAGYKIYCQRDARILHKESASVGKMSPLKIYYLNRNRILFMKRNYPFPRNLPFLIFFALVSFPKNTISFLVKGQFDHLKAFWKGVFYHLNSNLTY